MPNVSPSKFPEAVEKLPRFSGRTAEVATLGAQCRTARSEQDLEAERRASTQLARALARDGILLDQATKAARRALILGDDDALREELSAWFAGLGETSLASAALRPLLQKQSGAVARQTLIRIAVLSARAGDDAGAVDALRGAVKEDPTDPLPLELLGAVRLWSEASLSAQTAASYYLEAAVLRQGRAEGSASFEDLLRAFELSSDFEPAASAVAAALSARGRDAAADEVWRDHAAREVDGRELDWARLERALAANDLGRALGAAADGGFLAVSPENLLALAGRAEDAENLRAGRIQELLWQSGLGLVALARLALGAECERLDGPARGELWLRAGRAWLARFSNEEEASHAFQRALSLDPAASEALAEQARLNESSSKRE
ncbi:MAG: hypothetical protein H7X74_03170, partial [Methyloceanibacter sp.]|nr:hypothetical protein [Methyloceanibacter sp.]